MITKDDIINARFDFYEADLKLYNTLDEFEMLCRSEASEDQVKRIRVEIVKLAEVAHDARLSGKDLEKQYKTQESIGIMH